MHVEEIVAAGEIECMLLAQEAVVAVDIECLLKVQEVMAADRPSGSSMHVCRCPAQASSAFTIHAIFHCHTGVSHISSVLLLVGPKVGWCAECAGYHAGASAGSAGTAAFVVGNLRPRVHRKAS
jgi:hypothetical protein